MSPYLLTVMDRSESAEVRSVMELAVDWLGWVFMHWALSGALTIVVERSWCWSREAYPGRVCLA